MAEESSKQRYQLSRDNMEDEVPDEKPSEVEEARLKRLETECELVFDRDSNSLDLQKHKVTNWPQTQEFTYREPRSLAKKQSSP